MSTENTTPVESAVTDDLDAFTSELFGQSKPSEESTSSEDEDKTKIVDTDDTDASKEDSTDGDNTPADDDEDDEDEADQKEAPKQRKSRYQERIDELTSKARESERREKATNDKLAELEAKLNQNDKPSPAKIDDTGPQPDAVDENGDDVYPLGEFDPQYIRALTKFTIQQEREAMKLEDSQKAANQATETAKAELQTQWTAKLAPAQERYPDFVEKGTELLGTFDSISPSYGEYLESTIMSMEYGTDVLYYLANNVDEAQKIVNSGAAKATIALGRLEAKFAFADEEKQQTRPKVSKAPTPPNHQNKGSSVSRAEVADDTDDLDAFASKLFKKRG